MLCQAPSRPIYKTTKPLASLLIALAGLFLLPLSGNGQADIRDRWQFYAIEDQQGQSLILIDSSDYFWLRTDSTFRYELKGKDNLLAGGHYDVSRDTLILHYDRPTDTTRYYAVKKLTDTLLVINEGPVDYSFTRPPDDPPPPYPGENSLDGLPLNYDFSTNGFDPAALARGVLGLSVLVFLAFLMSSRRRRIHWPLIIKGLVIQFLFAVAILKVPFIRRIFDWLSELFVKLLSFTEVGAEFLFGDLISDTSSFGYIFAFQVLPTVIFFSALTSLLFYYGILQKVVYAFAWLMRRTMRLSGAESLAAAGNIFVGQTESPLLVKPYIQRMTRSELLCLMSGGMATIAGGVMAAYIGFLGGSDPVQQAFFAKHLLAASVMSAPAAVIAAKILLPETEKVNKEMQISSGKFGKNVLEAISNGTSDGLRLAVNVGAMLLVFIAMVALLNSVLEDGIGHYTGLNEWVTGISGGQYSGFTMQFILGYALAPLTWLMGVANEDLLLVGQLLGEKTILNEFVAYVSLGDLMTAEKFSSEKSIIIATYILCGFSNFASIGIQIGGIGAIAPGRKSDLSQLGFRALLAGTFASLFTAVIVGMLL